MLDVSQLVKQITAIFIALVVAYPARAHTQQPAKPVPAILIEAHEFEPCDYNCGAFNNPRTEYCVEVNGAIITGERKGLLWLGESDHKSLRAMTGMPVLYTTNGTSFSLATMTGQTVSISRQSKYEGFTEPRCRIQVHEFKLAEAKDRKRPSSIPTDAFAIAGSQIGDYKPDFVWFSCAKSPLEDTIDCHKWYPDGDSKGIERYCLTSLGGKEVPQNFKIDYLASSEGHLILNSSDPLRFDHRGRINNKLNDPNEACR